jgi:hypothetical protein
MPSLRASSPSSHSAVLRRLLLELLHPHRHARQLARPQRRIARRHHVGEDPLREDDGDVRHVGVALRERVAHRRAVHQPVRLHQRRTRPPVGHVPELEGDPHPWRDGVPGEAFGLLGQ